MISDPWVFQAHPPGPQEQPQGGNFGEGRGSSTDNLTDAAELWPRSTALACSQPQASLGSSSGAWPHGVRCVRSVFCAILFSLLLQNQITTSPPCSVSSYAKTSPLIPSLNSLSVPSFSHLSSPAAVDSSSSQSQRALCTNPLGALLPVYHIASSVIKGRLLHLEPGPRPPLCPIPPTSQLNATLMHCAREPTSIRSFRLSLPFGRPALLPRVGPGLNNPSS
ncbi:hypothetical protein VTJ04DRAFT_6350 [Mycothermus thermophilus]|uniref:uncharacterized protein n=1 Tax=Humicola insolens TaxID=85995 RepID=UPI00374494D8